jgi:hypothetical protein
MPEDQIRPIFYFLIGLGGLFVVLAVVVFAKMRRPTDGRIKATGTVVELVDNEEVEGQTFSPLVRYTTVEGREVVFKDDVRSYPPAYSVGEVVDVYYPPSNVDAAQIAASVRTQLVSLVLALLGIVFAALGWLGL